MADDIDIDCSDDDLQVLANLPTKLHKSAKNEPIEQDVTSSTVKNAPIRSKQKNAQIAQTLRKSSARSPKPVKPLVLKVPSPKKRRVSKPVKEEPLVESTDEGKSTSIKANSKKPAVSKTSRLIPTNGYNNEDTTPPKVRKTRGRTSSIAQNELTKSAPPKIQKAIEKMAASPVVKEKSIKSSPQKVQKTHGKEKDSSILSEKSLKPKLQGVQKTRRSTSFIAPDESSMPQQNQKNREEGKGVGSPLSVTPQESSKRKVQNGSLKEKDSPIELEKSLKTSSQDKKVGESNSSIVIKKSLKTTTTPKTTNSKKIECDSSSAPSRRKSKPNSRYSSQIDEPNENNIEKSKSPEEKVSEQSKTPPIKTKMVSKQVKKESKRNESPVRPGAKVMRPLDNKISDCFGADLLRRGSNIEVSFSKPRPCPFPGCDKTVVNVGQHYATKHFVYLDPTGPATGVTDQQAMLNVYKYVKALRCNDCMTIFHDEDCTFEQIYPLFRHHQQSTCPKTPLDINSPHRFFRCKQCGLARGCRLSIVNHIKTEHSGKKTKAKEKSESTLKDTLPTVKRETQDLDKKSRKTRAKITVSSVRLSSSSGDESSADEKDTDDDIIDEVTDEDDDVNDVDNNDDDSEGDDDSGTDIEDKASASAEEDLEEDSNGDENGFESILRTRPPLSKVPYKRVMNAVFSETLPGGIFESWPCRWACIKYLPLLMLKPRKEPTNPYIPPPPSMSASKSIKSSISSKVSKAPRFKIGNCLGPQISEISISPLMCAPVSEAGKAMSDSHFTLFDAGCTEQEMVLAGTWIDATKFCLVLHCGLSDKPCRRMQVWNVEDNRTKLMKSFSVCTTIRHSKQLDLRVGHDFGAFAVTAPLLQHANMYAVQPCRENPHLIVGPADQLSLGSNKVAILCRLDFSSVLENSDDLDDSIVCSIAWSFSRRFVAAGLHSCIVVIWCLSDISEHSTSPTDVSLQPFTTIRCFQDYPSPISYLSFTSVDSDRLLVVGPKHHQSCFFDIFTGREMARPPERTILNPTWIPSRETFTYSLPRPGPTEVRGWFPARAKSDCVFSQIPCEPYNPAFTAFSFSERTRRCFMASLDGRIRMIEGMQLSPSTSGHPYDQFTFKIARAKKSRSQDGSTPYSHVFYTANAVPNSVRDLVAKHPHDVPSIYYDAFAFNPFTIFTEEESFLAVSREGLGFCMRLPPSKPMDAMALIRFSTVDKSMYKRKNAPFGVNVPLLTDILKKDKQETVEGTP